MAFPEVQEAHGSESDLDAESVGRRAKSEIAAGRLMSDITLYSSESCDPSGWTLGDDLPQALGDLPTTLNLGRVDVRFGSNAWRDLLCAKSGLEIPASASTRERLLTLLRTRC